jgi:hypothetical protein
MKILIALALSLLLAACSTARFDPAKVSALQPGVSTINDAIHLLGPPSGETDYAEGSKRLTWQSAPGGAQAALVFDGAGRMIRVMQLTTEGKAPAAAPQPAAASGPRPALGISAATLTPEMAGNLKMTEPSGVIVAIVNPGSAAQRAGLSKGDVILGFNGARIRDMADFAQAMGAVAPGQSVTAVVWRGGKEILLTIAF